jgi:hypothetical protein
VRLSYAIIAALPLTLLTSRAPGADPGVEKSWKTYVMGGGALRLEYPASWFPIQQGKSRLSILSGKERAEAVIVVPGEALVAVAILPNTKPDQLDAFAQAATDSGDRVISNEVLAAPSTHGCSRIRRIVTIHEWAPQSHEVTTTFLCAISGQIVMCAESNFQGDAHQKQYENVALRMTRSIRLAQRK